MCGYLFKEFVLQVRVGQIEDIDYNRERFEEINNKKDFF